MSPVKKRATKKVAKKPAKKAPKKAPKKPAGNGVVAPLEAPGSPKKYRARVRMYRHGLGDCFLITLPA